MNAALKAVVKRRAKTFAIQSAFEAIAFSQLRRLWKEPAARGLIFTLHHVRPADGETFAPNAHLSITPDFLETVVVAALEEGLTPVHLDELPYMLVEGDPAERYVAFTFDDGYRDNAEFATPVLRAYNIPFTIFLVPGFVDRTVTIWWKTAEELVRGRDGIEIDFGSGRESLSTATPAEKIHAFDRLASFVFSGEEDAAVAEIDRCAREAGIDPVSIVEREVMEARDIAQLAGDPLIRFGAHTLSHPALSRVSEARLMEELVRSREIVADLCGRRPDSFAFPYGYASAAGEREFAAAREAGFSVAVTTRPGMLTPACLTRLTALPRVSLNGLFQRRRYAEVLISGIPFRLAS